MYKVEIMKKKTKEKSFFNEVVDTVFSKYSGDEKVEILKKHLTPQMIKVFENKDLIETIDAFMENNLNISETSRNMFMHRNTLLYRINKIRRVANLNLRNFEEAVAFRLLEVLYKEVYKK